MIRVNSISGGQTSAYIMANYKADFNLFALVRTNDKNCLFPDKKIRQLVSDKIQNDFIGTLEDDQIIYTILDLEQYTGQKIDWVTGPTFDEIIINKNGSIYLPNVMQRFCTQKMKLQPLFEHWQKHFQTPVEMAIGFRANEFKRANKMVEKLNKNGLSEFKTIVGKMVNGKNKWGFIEWQKPIFPLITDNINKPEIINFWENKPVRFAKLNNCVGCFHRNELLLNLMSIKHPNKFNWFVNAEKLNNGTQKFKKGVTYEKIKNYKMQLDLFEDDFNNSCDTGYCGL